MKRISYLGLIAAAGLALAVVPASATPPIDGVVYDFYVFADCPISGAVASVDNYPIQITIDDPSMVCPEGYANLHDWTLSADGGGTAADFQNGAAFKLSAVMTLSGDADGEAGLRISPWWSQLVDGRFNVRTTDGEIACFGGRLPFFSFTETFSINYVKGTPIFLEVTYLPNSLSMANPATIEYKLTYQGSMYTSGPLPFDEGNPAEDPPYGLWGMLNQTWVGGYVQPFIQSGTSFTADWQDICFQDLLPVQTEESSWGELKDLYR
jgi:hypothetical protein